MELTNTLAGRRYGVVVTLLSLVSIVLIFEYGMKTGWNTILAIILVTALVIFIISLVITFIKSGLWKFTHKPLAELDEREIALTSKVLRISYSLFTVIVLALLLSFALLGKPLNIVLVVSLILFAHLLPASVIAWTENHVGEDKD